MKSPLRIAHELAVTARFAGRALARRLAGRVEPPPDRAAFRQRCERWLAAAPGDRLAGHHVVEVPGDRLPWLDTGLDLAAGETVTFLAAGRVYLSRLLDIWVAPHFQLWFRIGETGEVFRGTREGHTVTAERGGRLYLGNYFPGEWADRQGRLATDAKAYRKTSGGMTVLVLRWREGVDPGGALAALAAHEGAPPQARAEAGRLRDRIEPPADWRYLWFLGPAEIYAPADGGMRCHTHADVGILRRELRLPLRPDTRLEWQWKVDELPSTLAEDTVPTHDYLSIAVEFDNGQDITWHWSAALPPETVYRCPLPTWRARETHIVIRSGTAGLGRWRSEARNVHDDCVRALGAPAGEIRAVWLIANSLFQRGHGRCEYRGIRLVDGEGVTEVTAP
ncbi:hypothetical protein PC39_11347 [Salinisphaera sp. PC39]|uniref:DUF3047 domain-containing protein n=1 Tax=Salinisphaera sp. PC39 TaxID=1304156 RepID=UPI00333F96F3